MLLPVLKQEINFSGIFNVIMGFTGIFAGRAFFIIEFTMVTCNNKEKDWDVSIMKKGNEWVVDHKYVKRYQGGYPLITKDAVTSGLGTAQEGDIVHMIDQWDLFIDKSY